jgi:hypothetical protein
MPTDNEIKAWILENVEERQDQDYMVDAAMTAFNLDDPDRFYPIVRAICAEYEREEQEYRLLCAMEARILYGYDGF